MTPGISLCAFIPCGAPDLHAAARRHMSGAMVFSSGLMTMLFLSCALILPRVGEPDLPIVPDPYIHDLWNVDGPTVVPPPVRPGHDEYVYTEVLPDPVVRVEPRYPEVAKSAGVDGMVVVRVLVGTDGRVLDMGIERSIPLLDAAALEAARQWVFTPARNNARSVMAWVRVPFKFELREERGYSPAFISGWRASKSRIPALWPGSISVM